MQLIEDLVVTNDGFRLYALAEVVNGSRVTAILCHGLTADHHESGFFDQISIALQSKGISVARFDYRGHGKSSGTSLDVTLSGETTDLFAIFSWLEQAALLKQTFLLVSASFSCHSAVRLASVRRPTGFIFLNPVFSYRRTFIHPEASWGKEILATRGDPNLPKDAQALVPGSHFYLSKKLWREMIEDDTPNSVGALTCPIISFHGDQDIKVPIQPIAEFATSNPNKMELVVRPDEGHGLKSNRPGLISEIANWASHHSS
jgi:pimeloyl-ACP methyl ester carboxylesterase